MSSYPGNEAERRIDAGLLRQLVTTIFARCGMTETDAALLADALVAADLRGVHSHGVLRVPEYVKKLRFEGVDPTGQPRIVVDNEASLVIDGRNSMGQIGATFAMRRALDRAERLGVAVATVRGSNHCGAMAYYAMMALPRDMIGLATTNALPTMAPWGGADKILGINPLAVAMPAAQARPLVLDFAFSGAAVGKIRIYQQKGLPIPPDWAFDPEGRPTTDPAAALAGLLQPIGRYKGTGLALVMGILSTLLSDASYGTELGTVIDGPRAGQDGHFFMALRIGAFTNITDFKRRLDGIVAQLQTSRRAPGVARIYAPGELEAETEEGYRRTGIPLNDVTLAGINETARQLAISPRL